MSITVDALGYASLSNATLLPQLQDMVAIGIKAERVDLVKQYECPREDTEHSEHLSTKPLASRATRFSERTHTDVEFISVAISTN